MRSERDLETTVYNLENKLANYHEQLEEALEHDRRLQMIATWGIVNTLVGITAFLLVFWLADWFGMKGWLLGTVAAFAALFAWGAAVQWSDKGRERDVNKLSRLPKWKRRG